MYDKKFNDLLNLQSVSYDNIKHLEIDWQLSYFMWFQIWIKHLYKFKWFFFFFRKNIFVVFNSTVRWSFPFTEDNYKQNNAKSHYKKNKQQQIDGLTLSWLRC